MNKTEEAILKTLSYARIFEYPLRLKEVQKYLINHTCDERSLLKALQILSSIIGQDGYYTFSDSAYTIPQRKKRKYISQLKLQKARKITKLLSLLPSILLIGVSGSLSMKNAANNDDIDLFFITKPNTLWITRFFVNAALIVMGEKRARKDRAPKDKICTNMFITLDNIVIKKQNLYTAHEVAQLKVLYGKDTTYEYFLYKNKWIKKYLPNIRIHTMSTNSFSLSRFTPVLKFCERLFFFGQKLYMKRHLTIEKIGQSHALFHPSDKTSFVISAYKKEVLRHCKTKDSKQDHYHQSKPLQRSTFLT